MIKYCVVQLIPSVDVDSIILALAWNCSYQVGRALTPTFLHSSPLCIASVICYLRISYRARTIVIHAILPNPSLIGGLIEYSSLNSTLTD